MSEIKRWIFRGFDLRIDESEKGGFVMYHDHAAEVERLRKQLADALAENVHLRMTIDELNKLG